MKGIIKTVFLFGIASLSFISCSSIRSFTSIAVEPGGVLIEMPTLAEVSVSDNRVEATLSEINKSLTRKEIEDNVIADALSKTQGDILLEPRYTTIQKGGKIKSITVSGYPAKYVDFRPLQQSDTALIRLEAEGHRYMILQNPMRTHSMSSFLPIEKETPARETPLSLATKRSDSMVNTDLSQMFKQAKKQRNAGITMFSTGAACAMIFYAVSVLSDEYDVRIAGITVGTLATATMIAGVPLWVSGSSKMRKSRVTPNISSTPKSLKMGVSNGGELALHFAF